VDWEVEKKRTTGEECENRRGSERKQRGKRSKRPKENIRERRSRIDPRGIKERLPMDKVGREGGNRPYTTQDFG